MKPFQLWSKEWKKGMIDIILRLGEKSYLVETPNGDTYRRNGYHLRKTKENPDPKEVSDITPCRSPEDQPTPAGPKLLSSPASAKKTTDNKTTIAPKTAAMPQCIRRPPQYLKDYVLKWLDMILKRTCHSLTLSFSLRFVFFLLIGLGEHCSFSSLIWSENRHECAEWLEMIVLWRDTFQNRKDVTMSMKLPLSLLYVSSSFINSSRFD